MDKLEIARRQLGTALQLFIDDACPVSVHTLAAAGAEVVEGIAKHLGHSSFKDEIMTVYPMYSERHINSVLRTYANTFKHFTATSGEVRDDQKAIEDFNDDVNESLLMKAWYDYALIASKLPLAAQAFTVWSMCRIVGAPYVEENEIVDEGLKNVQGLPLAKAKVVLRKLISDMFNDAAALANPLTEQRPLMMGGLAAVRDRGASTR